MPGICLSDLRLSHFRSHRAARMAFDGRPVAIWGANGAGKTTLMRAITGVAKVTAGTVALEGDDITRLPAPQILIRGVAMVPEGRRLFPSLTVEENLLIGAHARSGNGGTDSGCTSG